MKILNIALRALLATIGTAPCAHARIPSSLRDPRTVEEKEDVRRQTMGEHVLDSILIETAGDSGKTCGALITATEKEYESDASFPDEAKSLACSAVSKQHPECLGCQGYERKGKEVHIPGCVGMTSQQCLDLATKIVEEKSDWFKDGAGTELKREELAVEVADTYYALALPVSADSSEPEGSRFIEGLAGGCMVHYPWDWCVDDTSDNVKCIKIGPFDCSVDENGGSDCLSSNACCDRIQNGRYPAPDINGNKLQCYEWEIPSKSNNGGDGGSDSGGDSGGSDGGSGEVNQGSLVGNRLIIHLSNEKVALPAVITDGLGAIDDEDKTDDTPTGTTAIRQGDMCLVIYGQTADLAKCDGSANQDFKYDTGTMQIKLRSSGECLGPSGVPLGGLVMESCNDSPGQKWYTNSNHQLKSEGKDAIYCAANTHDYGEDFYLCNTSADQQWEFDFPVTVKDEEKTEDTHGIINQGDYCMNDYGTNAGMSKCDGSENQDFEYDEVTMQIKHHHSDRCLEMSTRVEVNPCHGGSAQKWYTTDNHELKSESREKCIGSYPNLHPDFCNGADYQQWEFNLPITKK